MEGAGTSQRPKVVVAETIAEAGLKALAEHCDVAMAVGMERPSLLEALGNAEGLVVRSATQVDAGMISAAPALRVIGRAGIGVDNIDLDAATAAGVIVVNAPEANTISAAEHAMALLLAQARKIPEADARTRGGSWDRKSFQGVELHGKTLGIIGLGRIGLLVSERARSFGMHIVAHDPYVSAESARRTGVDLIDLDRLLSESDFITIHLPRTRETEGMIGASAFGRMRSGVRIINTSRGGIVDEEALAEAVRSGVVAGAGLDVFASEPLEDSPLFSLPQVVLTPHLGASTVEAQDKAGVDVAEAVAASLRGELVLSAVNVDLGREVSDDVRSFLPMIEDLGQVFVSLARGIPERFAIRAEGRIAGYPMRPMRLAALKGVLAGSSSDQVSYVNAPGIAAARGLIIEEEKSIEAVDHVSLVRLVSHSGPESVSVAGTVTRKGPTLVEVLGLEVELPLSKYLLIIRNDDVPGLIGRVGTLLGDRQINIANMVVGREPGSNEPAMMGLSLDQTLAEEDVQALRALDGVVTARFVELPR